MEPEYDDDVRTHQWMGKQTDDAGDVGSPIPLAGRYAMFWIHYMVGCKLPCGAALTGALLTVVGPIV